MIQLVIAPSDFDISPLLKQAVEYEWFHAYENFKYSQPGLGGTLPAQHTAEKRRADESHQEKAHKKRRRSHIHRQKKCNKDVKQNGHQSNPQRVCTAIEASATFTIQIPIELEKLPATSCGYRAHVEEPNTDQYAIYTLKHYESLGYRALKWDGRYVRLGFHS